MLVRGIAGWIGVRGCESVEVGGGETRRVIGFGEGKCWVELGWVGWVLV